MSIPSKPERFCGWDDRCFEEATVSIVAADYGGHFGFVCPDHADDLERMLERTSLKGAAEYEARYGEKGWKRE